MVGIEIEKDIAIRILGEFEKILERKVIKIRSDNRVPDHQNEACLYGSEYYKLIDGIAEIRRCVLQTSDNASTGQEFFPVTSVHRDDIKEAMKFTDEQARRITDNMMREIATKITDDYCEQLFWDHLPIIAEYIFEREGLIFKGTGPNSSGGMRK